MRAAPIYPRLVRSHVVKFMEKVEIKPKGCWRWTGYVQPNGYGYYRYPDTQWAHRVSYLLFKGPIPEDLHLDHLCRNKACVNPDHLEAVTPAENSRRASVWTACEKYHPGQPARWATRGDGRTFCRECNRIREAQRRAAAAFQSAGISTTKKESA